MGLDNLYKETEVMSEDMRKERDAYKEQCEKLAGALDVINYSPVRVDGMKAIKNRVTEVTIPIDRFNLARQALSEYREFKSGRSKHYRSLLMNRRF